MTLVVDASTAVAWVVEDDPAAITAMTTRFRGATIHVPALWPTEVAQGVLHAERRRRIPVGHAHQRLALLREFAIHIEPMPVAYAFTTIVALARLADLTPYDAAYLELADRLDAPLATRDDRLARAARKRGLRVIS